MATISKKGGVIETDFPINKIECPERPGCWMYVWFCKQCKKREGCPAWG